MLTDLNMMEKYSTDFIRLGNNSKKAMTSAIVTYIEKTYSNEYEELKLVIHKAKKYLSK